MRSDARCYSISIGLILFVLTTAFLPRAACTETYSLVRYYIDTPADLTFVQSHAELDIATVDKRGSYIDIVATAKDLVTLYDSAGRHQIICSDLEAYYSAHVVGPEFGAYHTYSEAVAFIDSLRMLFPHVVSEKWSIGQSHEGRDLWCFRLSDNPDLDEGEPEVLFDGLHHPREIMASETPLLLAQYLAQNYGRVPEVTYLLDNREIYFVPIVNPDGDVYNETTNPSGGGMWRKNRRDNGNGCYGVDLNRNYPFMWGYGTDNPCYGAYQGPSAGSEPEIQALMTLINSHQFIAQQTFHSYGGCTLHPWGHTYDPPPDVGIFAKMTDDMTRYNGYWGGQCSSTLYLVSAIAMDWSYGAQDEHTKVFCVSSELGFFSDGFWPPEERRLPIFLDNLWPSLYLIRTAGAFIEVSNPILSGITSRRNQLNAGESTSLSFTLTNQGITADAFDVTVYVASDDPYIQLGSAYRYFGTVPAHTSVDLTSDPLPVMVDSACPPAHLTNLKVSAFDQNGAWEYVMPFIIGEPMLLFNDDFESGLSAWATTGTWNTTSASSHSPSHSLTDSPDSNYIEGTRYSVILNEGVTATHLSFWTHYDLEADYDFGFVQVSAEGGPWHNLALYTGNCAEWTRAEFSLDHHMGKKVQVRFLLDSDAIITEDGWYIDDVVLRGSDQSNLPPPPPTLVSPMAGAEVDTNPTLTVANSIDPDGTSSLTYGFRVYIDSLCTKLAASVNGVPEGSQQTAWSTPPLDDGYYWWRAYAADSIERGLLGDTRSFKKKSAVSVLIQRFEAKRMNLAIRLDWEVLANEDIAGFNIYRKSEHEESEKLINEHGLIPASDRSYEDDDYEYGHIYYYVLCVVDTDNNEIRSHTIEVKTIEYIFSLQQNYPNPFNPITTISFTLPEKALSSLSIYNLEGKLVRTLMFDMLDEGYKEFTWNGTDSQGNTVSSGVYFYRLKTGKKVLTKKMVLLK